MKDKKINFLLAGYGKIGERHASLMNQLGNLLGVCDVDSERASEAAARYDAGAFTDFEAMLDAYPESDLVSICTPNYLHASQSIIALGKKFNVLCEKPMAISSSDCAQMIKAADEHNRKLFVVKQNRFNPPVVELKKMLDEGLLGKIYSIQLSCFWNRDINYYYKSPWKGKMEFDGGMLFTQFSHFIDLLYWLFGDVVRINAFTRNYAHKNVIEFEDSCAAILEFESGITGTANFTVNAFEKNMEGSLTVLGEKGTVKIGGQYLNEMEYHHVKDYKSSILPSGNPANHYDGYSGSMSNHPEVYRQVLGLLSDEGPVLTNSRDALKSVEIIDRIYKSAFENK